MVSRKTILSLLLIGLTTVCFSQKHLFSEVEIKKTTAYVGEPIEVIVSAYTSTWFTKGVDLGNVKVNGAFTVYFRSVSNSMNIDGQTYAGVRLYYHVFPYDDEDIEFPALEIKVETPDLGDYKGKPHTIKTLPKTIKIISTPDAIEANEWLVTTNLSVIENWSTNRQNVKVGDVLERSIDRVASNTISELIPPVKWDSVTHISLYPTRSAVENIKTKTAINGARTDGVRYLFEKEGEIEIPALVFTWWNPVDKQLYKRTLPSIKINVLPNPDLGMLATLQDSLTEQSASELIIDESNSKGILGLSWWQIIGLFVLFALVIYLFVKAFIHFKEIYLKRKIEYLKSERLFFDLFEAEVRKDNQIQIQKAMYRWLDELILDEPTAISFAKTYGSFKLMDEVKRLESHPKEENKIRFNIKNWKVARSNYLTGFNRNHKTVKSSWINP
jgi:hypothetical protein